MNGMRIRLIGPTDAQIEIEVPEWDEVQEQIDFIRWVTEQEQPHVLFPNSEASGRDGLADDPGGHSGGGGDSGDPVSLAEAIDQALAEDSANGDVFSGDDDISEKQALEAALAQKDEELALANERIAELESREPEVRIERVEVERIVERVVEVSSPEAAPLKIIPDEIAAMMDPGDTFSPEVRRKLTERLNVELAELKNLRGLAGEDLKREAEIEKLLGLFARLGEI